MRAAVCLYALAMALATIHDLMFILGVDSDEDKTGHLDHLEGKSMSKASVSEVDTLGVRVMAESVLNL